MRLKYVFLIPLLLLANGLNAFAEGENAPISIEFPADNIMLENHVYTNAAVFENLGIYGGEIDAIAIYDVESYHCDSGYYLPKDSNECVKCDADSYCGGGTFAYNEESAQGITACPDDMNSLPGASTVGECGKILHVGEDVMYLTSEKQTAPAFAVMMNNKTYYAKMSPAENGKKPMNKNTTRSMKVLYNNHEYYVYDGTVTE